MERNSACVSVHQVWSRVCLCVCVCAPVWEQCAPQLKVLESNLRPLVSLLSHWLNGLIKCSVIQSGEQIPTTTVKPNHRGAEPVYMRLREMWAESRYSAPISCQRVHPPRFPAEISLCLCVYGPLPAPLQGLSVNQSALTLYTGRPDWPRLLVDTVYSCFLSARLLTPQPCLLQTWAAK